MTQEGFAADRKPMNARQKAYWQPNSSQQFYANVKHEECSVLFLRNSRETLNLWSVQWSPKHLGVKHSTQYQKSLHHSSTACFVCPPLWKCPCVSSKGTCKLKHADKCNKISNNNNKEWEKKNYIFVTKADSYTNLLNETFFLKSEKMYKNIKICVKNGKKSKKIKIKNLPWFVGICDCCTV